MLYLAAVLIVASVALFVAAPLGGGALATRRAGRDAAEAERLEHERALAMQGLRELEFDREMGKLSDADYASLHEGLMTRALVSSGRSDFDSSARTNSDSPAEPVGSTVSMDADPPVASPGGKAVPRTVMTLIGSLD